MAVERTLSIIKPDATRRNLTGAINDRFEKRGLRIVAQKRIRLSTELAERFYEVHAQRPFYRSLVTSMTTGPVVTFVTPAAASASVPSAKNAALMPGTLCSRSAEPRAARGRSRRRRLRAGGYGTSLPV